MHYGAARYRDSGDTITAGTAGLGEYIIVLLGELLAGDGADGAEPSTCSVAGKDSPRCSQKNLHVESE
jgi:hypothetical protein